MTTITTRWLSAGLAATGLFALSGCDAVLDAVTGPSATLEDGLVTYVNPPTEAEIEPLILGVLRWDGDNACWYTESPRVPGGEPHEVTTVFAEGTTSEPGQAVTFPGGEVARPGDEIVVGGGPHAVGDRAEFGADMVCGDRPLMWSVAVGPLPEGARAPEGSAG